MKTTTFKLLSLFESNFKFHIIPYPTLLRDHNMGFVHGIGNCSEDTGISNNYFAWFYNKLELLHLWKHTIRGGWSSKEKRWTCKWLIGSPFSPQLWTGTYFYQSQDGIVLNVQLSNETVWLSQDQLTVFFERDQSVISRHLSNLYKEGELTKESNMQKLHIANSDKPFY